MKKLNLHSFKFRLTITIMLIFAIPVAIISLVVDNKMKQQLKEDFINFTSSQVSQVDTTIYTYFEEIKQNTELMSQNPVLAKADDTITDYLDHTDDSKMTPSQNGGIETAIYNEFERYAKAHPKATYVYMGTELGGYVQWPESGIMKNYDPRKRFFYLSALETKGQVNISDPYYFPTDDTFGLSVVKTYNNEKGELFGVVGIDVGLNDMTDMIKQMNVGKSGYIILVDSKGVIIAHPLNAEYNMKSLSELEIKGLEDITKIKDTNYEAKIDNKDSIVNVQTSEKTGWKYVTIIDRSEVMEGATDVEKVILILALVSLLIAVFVSIFVSGRFANPIGTFVEVLKAVQSGDFTREVPKNLIKRKDEMGILAGALSDTEQNISTVLQNINSSSSQVALGAGQVASSSQALSQGATEQASSIEEITASMEQLASQTKINASNATNANRLADSARANAMQGNNAADEAARAGQHGKGFAVVAEEVRNLAARSASAAKETTAMIEGSMEKVEVGTQIASDTAQALSSIVEGVAEVAKLVGEIAHSSNDQAAGFTQINQAIMQVSQVVQSNSATSEEVAAASQEMSSQATVLKEMVSAFKLKSYETIKKSDFDNLDPEIIKMIESYNGSIDIKNHNSKVVAPKAIDTVKPKIDLNNDFGKY